MDEAGVYVGGSNQAALVTRSFAAPGRRGRLIDGLRHTVLALYAEGKLSVHFDGVSCVACNASFLWRLC